MGWRKNNLKKVKLGVDNTKLVCYYEGTESKTPINTKKGEQHMGQTDSQFKAFIRFVLDALREIAAETDEAKRAAKMEKVLDNLQKTLED